MNLYKIITLIILSLLVCGPKKSEEVEGEEKKAEMPPPPLQPGKIKIGLSVKDKKVVLTGKEKAVIETNKGTFVIKFFPEDAPNTVKNFIRLAEAGFYDGLYFHRYEPDFVIQGGDPLGNGSGDAGYKIKAEFNKRKHLTGTVGMARGEDPNSASCQFYITLSPQPHLDGKYTVFGRVVKGMDVVRKLRAGDWMKKVRIVRE